MAGRTHGHRSGNWKSPTYSSWQAMIARCTHPTHVYFAYYGGRGIRVCSQWVGPGGFAQFLEDVGVRPAGHTLDRIDVDGNYEPGNVRWATPKQQAWNRRHMAAVVEQFPSAYQGDTGLQPSPDLPF